MAKKPAEPPPHWTEDELDSARETSIAAFRELRMKEPLEQYLDFFDRFQGKFEDLLETTVDLSTLDYHAAALLRDVDWTVALRYLSAPPISEDDLKVVAEVSSLAHDKISKKADEVSKVVETIRLGLDRRRFPWVAEGREPTETERRAAVVATAALIASQHVATRRRNEGKKEQEEAVRSALLHSGFKQVPAKSVPVIQDAPKPGYFSMETKFGERKADLLIGLHDRRVMPVECKVSNSAINSIKRLKNDAAVKAVRWREEFGQAQVVPTAVLSGVYDLRHLISAQTQGLTLFWAHDLAAFTNWIRSTKS